MGGSFGEGVYHARVAKVFQRRAPLKFAASLRSAVNFNGRRTKVNFAN